MREEVFQLIKEMNRLAEIVKFSEEQQLRSAKHLAKNLLLEKLEDAYSLLKEEMREEMQKEKPSKGFILA